MVDINLATIQNKDSLTIYNLNYPIIDTKKYNLKILNDINNRIYQDIVSFQDIVENDIESMRINNNFLFYINTEYDVKINKNNIMSISIEFSQLAGLYDINYINTYNYDINLEQEITLKDLFKINIDYKNLIVSKINRDMQNLFKNELSHEYIQILDYTKDNIILDEPQFYIEEDGIVICFSSYELDVDIKYLTYFKLEFREYQDYLSKYAIENIIN